MNMNNNKKIAKDWSFSGDLHKVFSEHIKKSIPNYESIHKEIISIFEFISHKNAKVLDLGFSTCSLLIDLYDTYNYRNIDFEGYEIEEDMYKHSLKRIGERKINLFNKNLLELKDNNCYDLILSVFTLQFLNFKDREVAIKSIYDSLQVGGCFILAEKVISNNPRDEKILSSLLYEHKKANGLSDSEILSKEFSLRGVMHCKTNKEIEKEFISCGFESIEIIQKQNSFVLYLIRK